MFSLTVKEVRLGKDAEIHESNGNKFLTATAAFNQNTKERETIWYDVLCFNFNDKLVQYYKKGSLLVLTGDVVYKTDTWKDGSVHERKQFIANRIDFPSNAKNEAGDTNAATVAQEPKQEENAGNGVSMYASKKKKANEQVPEPVVTTATAQGGEIDNSDLPF